MIAAMAAIVANVHVIEIFIIEIFICLP